MLKKINERYMNWYFNNPRDVKKMCIQNVIIGSLINIALLIFGMFDILKIFLWIWGLSIANLVIEWNRGDE